MGIALLLLRRTIATRPKRTFLFILGYALAAAVMVTLLAVGEAVLLQAQDKDLLGGGDLILVPQGIDLESMKVGGLSALYYSIPQARFLVRQVLKSSRFSADIETISPYVVPKLVYLQPSGRQDKNNAVAPVFVEGSIPDSENRLKKLDFPWANNASDDSWLNPPAGEFYHEIDHFHLPTVKYPDMDRWAEWHYFNFSSGGFYGYLSIMATGDILNNKGQWIVSLQIHDDVYKRYSTVVPVPDRSALPLQRVDYNAGQTHVEFVDDHYEIDLDFHDRFPIRGKLRYDPARGLYFPPTVLAKNDEFESGYVIPAIRGRYQGSIDVGAKTYDFNNVNGYHDHNWGIWQQIEWNWGHAFSDEFAIFFGEIFLNKKSKGVFAGVYDQNGFLTLLRPDRIEFSDSRQQPDGLIVPLKLRMNGEKRFASLDLSGQAARFVTTPLEGQNLYFVQFNMTYDVNLVLDGTAHRFSASGNAETFVPAR